MVVFIERFLHCHRAQINSTEFLNGVRTVLARQRGRSHFHLRRHAGPGGAPGQDGHSEPRQRPRAGAREPLEEAGLAEVPRLEEKLNLLATIAQIAPLLGLLGTVLGFIDTFHGNSAARVCTRTSASSPTGIWEALICAAAGLAVAIPGARRLQLSRQPRQLDRARHGTRRDGNREHRHGDRQSTS